MAAEGIVRAGADHAVQLLAIFPVLLDDGDRHGPLRILLTPNDLGDPLGGRPTYLADPYRVGNHHLRFAGLVRREVEQPHCGDVDDDALTRGIRQHELGGQNDEGAIAGDPRVDLGIRPSNLFVADVEPARDVGERVVLGGMRRLDRSDDVLVGDDLKSLGLHRRRSSRNHRRRGWRRRQRLVMGRIEERTGPHRQAQQGQGSPLGHGRGPDHRALTLHTAKNI